MRRETTARIQVTAALLLALALCLQACNAYDESLMDLGPGSSGNGGGAGGPAGTGGGGGQAGSGANGGQSGGSGFDGGGPDGEAPDGEQPPGPGCVPGPEGVCVWSCPEVCDGADNDCDGDTDESEDGALCALDNAVSQCVKGSCVIESCNDLFGDCDNRAENGCETALNTLSDCGQCGAVCNGESCLAGTCTVTEGCEQGWADCDASDGVTCETELGTDTDCGGCGDNCNALPQVQAASCVSNACDITACSSGWDDCDGDYRNGCERDLGQGGCTPDIDIFVDAAAGGAEDGTSWENAYTSLADAIDAAGSGKKVGVKEGTYGTGGTAYALKTGVQIYGGFSSTLTGTYGYIANRDLVNDVTVIDGGDSSRCLSAAADGYLDGFTVQNCRASGASGGAIYIDAANVTFRNCIFKDSSAANFGGAFRVMSGGNGLQVVDSVFENNQGTDGGAIYGSAAITLTDCAFDGNSATTAHGGALRMAVGDATCTGCSFTGNSAALEGGAVYVTGAITFSHSVFIGNHSGGAAVGGAVRVVGTGGSYTNCLFADNTGSGGGAVFADSGGDSYTNCTFEGNRASITSGGALWGASSTSVVNSIFWGNTAPSSSQIYPADVAVDHTDIQGGWSGTGNLDSDPLFTTGPAGNYYLSATATGQAGDSPCIDAGNNTAVGFGLDSRTTRTDGVNDSGTVDLGYHY